MKKGKNLNVWLAMSIFLLAMVTTAAGQTIYVDTDSNGLNDGSSWANAYNFLQDALVTAASSDEIRVAQGIYRPDENAVEPNGTGNRGAVFQLKTGVTLKGGYAGFGQPDPNVRDVEAYKTILSGDLLGDDGHNFAKNIENSYHVVNGSGTDETAVLDGFTITAGNANGSYPSCNGGGMYNKYGGSPTVVNCTFRRNSARVNGGGMYISMYSDPLLSHCSFIGNKAKNGGGIYNSGGTEQNICEPELINCVFSGNLSDWVGGMRDSGRSILTGCTFSGNMGEGTGGMYDLFGRATLTNCILWGNIGGGTGESAQIQTYETYIGDTDINYCCIQGWTGTYGGVGNIGDSPLFVDANGADNVFGTADDNLRLLPGSSCLDAGDNDSVPFDSLDLDGDGDVSEAIPFDIDRNQRFIDEVSVPDTGNGTPPIVDIGAYESINQGFLLSAQSVIVPEGGTATFTVALAMNPGSTVEVTVYHESGDEDVTVQSGALLTFDSSNYLVPQSVTLAAAEDKDNLHGSALIQIIADGFAAAGVSVSEQDNDPIPTVLYVDSNATGLNDGVCWEDAYVDLQEAINIAIEFPHVEEILVADGVYRPASPGGDRGATFHLISGVTIKGGYAGYGEPDPDARDVKLYETILSGDLNGDDEYVAEPPDLRLEPTRSENSYHVVTGSGVDPSAILDGFTVTGGNGGQGGGMLNEYGNPTVDNCLFFENSGGYNGLGGGMLNSYSSPIITGCSFVRNAASWPGGGGMSNYQSSPTLTDCMFIGNTANSRMYGGEGSAGAMDNWENSSPTLTNCIFIGNYASSSGGAICSGGNYTNTVSNPALINCTIVGNSAGRRAGAIVQESGTLTLTNCIMWNNTSPDGSVVYLDDGYQVDATVNVSYGDIEGGQSGFYIKEGCTLNWGDGNIDADPLFVDPNNSDYHLQSEGWRWDTNRKVWTWDDVTSPCIDAGNPGCALGDELLSVPDDPNNEWGENLRINMGAYGGTAQASMPPYGWALLGDLSNDGIIDYVDLGGQVKDWLTTASQQPGDLNRDGIVNMADFALLAQDWLAKTSWYKPPIVLEIYALGCWGVYLLDTITMPEEGEITITSELPPQSSYAFVYAFREGYYTEIYNLDESNTINVDLDPIVPTKFNGTIFLTDPFFTALYLADTDVNVIDGDTVVGQFRTDEQGRFAIEMEPGNYYFEFYECASGFGGYHREEVEIQGQYKDFFFHYDSMVDKPNIYLYPEKTIEVDVNIVFPHGGRLRTSIPEYGDGWHITVEPSGIIDGQYECLFYESLQPDYGQYAAGWVVIREQLEDFFRNNMGQTGFNQKEIDDFIEYWIPILTEYPYYAIYPQYKGELEEMIKLEFSAQPESLIRLIYSVRGLEDNNLNIQEPVIPPFTRDGFTVTEWGVILK